MQMARLPRLSLEGFTQHVIQRGNNRAPCFFCSDDYEQYLDYLSDAMEKYDIKLHVYCLISNHVHLLMTPSVSNGISRALQDIGRRYVRYINFKYNRTGTLWDGRYHSCLVENDFHILDCYRYIESIPVRKDIQEKPELYKWSSYGCNALNKSDCFITSHSKYLELANNYRDRSSEYKKLFNIPLSTAKINEIQDAVKSNRVYGSDNFIYWV